MKQSEGCGIKLRKKISESIQAKTFIGMLTLLIGCCVVIYARAMIFLPKHYYPFRTGKPGDVRPLWLARNDEEKRLGGQLRRFDEIFYVKQCFGRNQ